MCVVFEYVCVNMCVYVRVCKYVCMCVCVGHVSRTAFEFC